MNRSDLARGFESTANAHLDQYRAILPGIVTAVTSSGDALRRGFQSNPRPRDFDVVRRLMDENDAMSRSYLRGALQEVRPGAQWVDDEDAVGTLPAGEWWVVDPVEGNINKAHGLIEFSVSATLVRDNRPVIGVVHLPLTGDTYTAISGGGATQNAVPMRVSPKSALVGAFVATSQNGAGGETAESAEKLGRSVAAMLGERTVVRVSPPPTLHLVQVAAGRLDAFWQYNGERAGLLAGALMISESGGTVTDVDGSPWTLASTTILAATPTIHPDALALLSSIQ